jgi:hypothetical protein
MEIPMVMANLYFALQCYLAFWRKMIAETKKAFIMTNQNKIASTTHLKVFCW